MNVHKYLDKVVAEGGAGHLTLIDPDEQDPGKAGRMASSAESAGTDGIMVGGSTSAEGDILDETVKEIKSETDVPVILFPASAGGVSEKADAIFFMSLLNSEDPFYIIGAQKNGAPLVKKFGIEPISMAYLIFEPGEGVGKVGKADLILRDDTETAVAYSIASQYLGMESIYLEAGSGAEKPVPVEVIREVREAVDSILIAGGGIRSPELASERVEVGADIIVTGTLVEEAEEFQKIESLIDAMKE